MSLSKPLDTRKPYFVHRYLPDYKYVQRRHVSGLEQILGYIDFTDGMFDAFITGGAGKPAKLVGTYPSIKQALEALDKEDNAEENYNYYSSNT